MNYENEMFISADDGGGFDAAAFSINVWDGANLSIVGGGVASNDNPAGSLFYG